MSDKYLPELQFASYEVTSGSSAHLAPLLLVGNPQPGGTMRELLIADCLLITCTDQLAVNPFRVVITTNVYHPLNANNLGIVEKLILPRATAWVKPIIAGAEADPSSWTTADLEDALLERIGRINSANQEASNKTLEWLHNFLRQRCALDGIEKLNDAMYRLQHIKVSVEPVEP